MTADDRIMRLRDKANKLPLLPGVYIMHAKNFLLNCIDDNYKNDTAKIIVKGGTFVNFNPANCKAEGEGTNFVADGYKVVTETHGTDTWYTVVPE